MKKLAAVLTIGAVLTGACAAGTETATAPPFVPEEPSAEPMSDDSSMSDSMSDASSASGSMSDDSSMSDPMSDTSPLDEVEDERDVVDLAVGQAPDPEAVARCQAVVTELERREANDLLIDDESGEELTEEQVEQYQHQAPEIDGSVMGADRPTFPDMPAEFDLTAVDQEELFIGVDLCYESGVLADDVDEDDELDEEDMAEFCAELASLSADEVAEWAADEGDEVVDEEFGWCELQRPDRQ